MGTLVAEVVPKGAMKRGAKIALDTRRQWVIGSDTQSAQIVVNADFLDASHAALVLSEFGDSWAVVDGGCENGTFLNGQRVTRARLQNGDSISFGLGRNVRQSSSLPEVAVRLSFRFIAAHDMLQCQAPQSVGMADDATAQDDCMAKYSKQVASVGRGAECQSQAIEIADLSAQLSHVRRQLDIVNQDKRALQAQLEIALRQVDELRADGPKLHTCLSCGAVSVVGGHLPSAPDPVAGRPALDDTIVFQGKQGAGVKLTGESDGARGPAAASLTKPESTISEGTEIGQEVWDRLEEALQKLDSKPSAVFLATLQRLRRNLGEGEPRDPLRVWDALLLPASMSSVSAATISSGSSQAPRAREPWAVGRHAAVDLLSFGQVWKRLMEERLACFRSELKEIKAWVQAPKVVANVVELVLLILGTHEVLVHRSCPWAQLRKLLQLNPHKPGELLEQMQLFSALRVGDEIQTASQVLAGIRRECAERAGDVCALLFHWASLQVRLWEIVSECRCSKA